MRDRIVSVVFRHSLSDTEFATFEAAKQDAKAALKLFVKGQADLMAAGRPIHTCDIFRVEKAVAGHLELIAIVLDDAQK
jgi:hypothetical protein